jgi:hypothetical protein
MKILKGLFATVIIASQLSIPFFAHAQSALTNPDICAISSQSTKYIKIGTPIPGVTQTLREKTDAGSTGTRTVYAVKDLPCFIIGIYKYFAGIAGVLSAVMIMYGGYKYVISFGSPARFTDAQDTIVSAMVGLALTLGSYIILYTINPALVDLSKLSIKDVAPVEQGLSGDWENLNFCRDKGEYTSTVNCGSVWNGDDQKGCIIVGGDCTHNAQGVCLGSKILFDGKPRISCFASSNLNLISLTYTKPGETEKKERKMRGDPTVSCGLIKDDCTEVPGTGACLVGGRGIGTKCPANQGCVIFWDNAFSINTAGGLNPSGDGIIGSYNQFDCY